MQKYIKKSKVQNFRQNIWLLQPEDECIDLATRTAMPSHNHPEGIKGAVVTALVISYADIHDDYTFNSTCEGTVGPAIICFLDSKDYVDCIKLAISLGGDADTLAAIAGPMAYAYSFSTIRSLCFRIFLKKDSQAL